ncbi:MAG: quinol:cytochrome C oxidoreductase [Ignavibacteria bacterium]|nr:quinol:cytochrome C oxidoreductase [Ignavibacteria bacterium]
MNNENFTVNYEHKKLHGSVTRIGFFLLITGLLIVIAGALVDQTRNAYSNLITFMFLSSIGIGSLFLVILEYIAGAVWSTPMRRVSEFFAFSIPFLVLFGLPLFFNLHDLFHWTHTDAVAADKVLKGKSPYLNETFFIIRFVFFFAIWTAFYFFIKRNSEKQDKTKDQSLTRWNIRISGFFIPVFAITLSFFAIDWLMSLEPHWFSTIFGVYYFSGTMLAALASGTFVIVLLHEKGYFSNLLRPDHFYSMGALMFAFINFWAYIAFSQFLLIWYANIPEETFWMISRWQNGWEYVSFAMIVVHFLVPYVGLLSQSSKMDTKRLKVMSLWILFAHYLDIFWLVMPSHYKSFSFSWIEFGFPLHGIGLLILVFTWKFNRTNLIPIGDPKLKRGLDFHL